MYPYQISIIITIQLHTDLLLERSVLQRKELVALLIVIEKREQTRNESLQLS